MFNVMKTSDIQKGGATKDKNSVCNRYKRYKTFT